MALAGISSCGVKLGYAVETPAGTQPTSFKQLTRINAIGGIALEAEQIDASALEDTISRSIAGRAGNGGTFTVTVNMTDDTVTEWTTLIAAAKTANSTNLSVWWEIWSPYLTKAFFIKAQPPEQIPMPEFSQNGLQTVEMTLTINEYVGLSTAVEPSAE